MPDYRNPDRAGQPLAKPLVLILDPVLTHDWATNKMIFPPTRAVQIYGADCLRYTDDGAVALADRVCKRKVELISVEPRLHAVLTRLLRVRRALWS